MVQQNLEFYVTPPVSLADNGSVITLLVSNTFSVATQSVMINVAAVTPTLVQAVGSLSDDAVTVTFNVPVDSYTALQVANYSIPGLRILSVSRDDRIGRRVILRTSPQTMGTLYTLAVSNVKDASGTRTIIPNSMVTFGAWATGGAGAFYVEIFTNIPGGLTENLTSDPKFIYNLPDIAYYTNRFGVGGFGLDSFFQANNYGARVTGWFTAPSNGVYAFYVRGDDGTKVFMNTNGSDPAGKVLIARNDGANSATFALGLGLGRVGNSASPPLTLTAGTAYYVEAVAATTWKCTWRPLIPGPWMCSIRLEGCRRRQRGSLPPALISARRAIRTQSLSAWPRISTRPRICPSPSCSMSRPRPTSCLSARSNGSGKPRWAAGCSPTFPAPRPGI
jgi:hypothetical protein